MANKMLRMLNEDGTQEIRVPVKDAWPDLDLDVEGKYIVEVSVELFIELAKGMGFRPAVEVEAENAQGA